MKWLRKGWVRGVLIAIVALGTAYLVSWLFGFASQICDPPNASGYQNCYRDNAVTVFLWKIYRLFDAGSAIITALATFAIAYLTKTLAEVSNNQKTILEAQTEISKQQMLVEHRPILRVRHVALVDANGGQLSRLPGIGEKVRGGLAVVNMGGTKAKVIDSRYLIYFAQSRDGLPMISPMDEKFDTLLAPETPFKIGESVAVSIVGVVTAERPPGTFMALGAHEWTVFVMGQIQYRDEGGNDRFMGFCRKWQGEGTFRTVDEPDYEYSD
jgi:hypothetical protein